MKGKNWRGIQKYIGSRTCAQTRSHAQKLLLKLRAIENDEFNFKKESIKNLSDIVEEIKNKEGIKNIDDDINKKNILDKMLSLSGGNSNENKEKEKKLKEKIENEKKERERIEKERKEKELKFGKEELKIGKENNEKKFETPSKKQGFTPSYIYSNTIRSKSKGKEFVFGESNAILQNPGNIKLTIIDGKNNIFSNDKLDLIENDKKSENVKKDLFNLKKKLKKKSTPCLRN